jgi:hypothetical protein
MSKPKKKQSWFWNMLSGANGDISSKRFFGGVGLCIMHTLSILSIFIYPESHWIGELLITLTITDAGLLGVGVFEKERKSKSRRNSTYKEHNEEEELDIMEE